jgi:hypothetical protein
MQWLFLSALLQDADVTSPHNNLLISNNLHAQLSVDPVSQSPSVSPHHMMMMMMMMIIFQIKWSF